MNAARSPWRWFPSAMIAALAAVAIVNGTMIYLAVHTFPGSAGEDGYDLGQVYDHILQGASQQQALGWRMALELGGDRRVSLRLTARERLPLEGASVRVVAARPVGPPESRVLALAPSGAGTLRAEEALPTGQWTLSIDVARQSDRLTETKRLVVP